MLKDFRPNESQTRRAFFKTIVLSFAGVLFFASAAKRLLKTGSTRTAFSKDSIFKPASKK
ncbi:MAG: hypothetical protein MK334_00540 [SAR202 cluster bacterium]|nr:hypothetical protein [SAR202 cluster bacterium]|tara:strand:+ start:21998 stop:22177 length:180 start_codon:yes stop_codon:yes gene_type:complete